MDMKGKTVLITGSTDGVGRYVASELARQRAHVLIHGRDAGRAKAVVDAIASGGGYYAPPPAYYGPPAYYSPPPGYYTPPPPAVYYGYP